MVHNLQHTPVNAGGGCPELPQWPGDPARLMIIRCGVRIDVMDGCGPAMSGPPLRCAPVVYAFVRSISTGAACWHVVDGMIVETDEREKKGKGGRGDSRQRDTLGEGEAGATARYCARKRHVFCQKISQQ